MKQVLIVFLKKLKYKIYNFCAGLNSKNCGHFSDTSRVWHDIKVYNKKNFYLYDDVNIDAGSVIMNTRARFIMKKNSTAAFGFTAITGGHLAVPTMLFKDVTDEVKDKLDSNHKLDRDIIVEEEVWIASNVTILKGVTIGRGGVIGSGSVVRYSTPPYAIVIGNPAKVIGFKFTLEKILEHEALFYEEEERIPLAILEENYNKYVLNRSQMIDAFKRL